MDNDLTTKKKIISDILFLSQKDNLTFEEKKVLTKNYNLHFHYYRYSNAQWKKLIDEEILKIKNDDFNYHSLFNLKEKLEERHYHSLKYISEKQSMPSLFFNFYQEISGHAFINSYKSHLMFKHFQSCLFHSLRFSNFKYKNQELLDSTNRHSISGKLFIKEGSDTFFCIPKNKAPTFLFLDKGKIIGVDVSIDYEVDRKNMIPHFLFTHDSYDEDINKLKSDFVSNSKKEYDEIIMSYCDGRHIDNGKVTNMLKLNCNYLMCFENDIGNHLISRESLGAIKTIGLENHSLYDLLFGNRFYSLLFNQLNYSGKVENQKPIDRDYSISYLLKILIENKTQIFKNGFDHLDQEYIQNALTERLVFILRGLDNERSSFVDFKRACTRAGVEKESDISDIYKKIIYEDDFNDLPIFVKENKFIKEMRVILVGHILKDIISKGSEDGLTPQDIVEKIIPFSSIQKVRKIKSMLKKI